MTKQTKTKPLAGYVRVSRKGTREDDRFRSPDFQRAAIERYVQLEGHTVQWFEPEVDVSGSKPKRAILDEIIARIQRGELGGIIVAKLDRLSRLKPKDRMLLFEAIEEQAGGIIRSASEDIDPSTPEGRFARDVFLGVARMQWEKYADQFETAKSNAIAEGIPVHTRPPIGYRTGLDRRLVVDEKVAPLIRELFERRARGEGPSELARFLEERRLRTTQGSKTWAKQAVYGVLKNRTYIGELAYGRDVDQDGRRRPRYVNPTAHEPIVSRELFEAAQHPNGRPMIPLRSERSSWLLAGLLRCAGCGYSLQGTMTSRRKRIYRCNRRHAGGICPEPARLSAETIEEAVIVSFWRDRDRARIKGRRESSNGSLAKLQHERERTQRVLTGLLAPEVLAVVGDLPEHAAKLRQAREADERAAAALGRAEAKAKMNGKQTVPVEHLRELWENEMTTSERRELLSEHFDLLVLGRDRRLVLFKTGTGPADLPRPGFNRNPGLVPFELDVPASARTVAL
jgi:DNA invertase Pin-like site-specific DNA recombinase